MKTVPLVIHGVLLGLLTTPLQADPVLATPGTATWSNKDIATGTRTEFTLTGNTVLNWDHLNLKSGSEIDFNFVAGDSVLNMLGGSRTHIIDGDITANGHVGFVSPNAGLVVRGSITGESVTLSTLNVDPTDFADRGGMSLSGGSSRFRPINIAGRLEATGGDVLVAGPSILISPNGMVSAKIGGVLYAAGEDVQVAERGGKRLKTEGSGSLVHNGISTAGRIEVVAGDAIKNAGLIGQGNGGSRVFVEVGSGGKIINEGRGVMVGISSLRGSLDDDGLVLYPADGDNAQLVTDARIKLPALKGGELTFGGKEKRLVSTLPMKGASDAGRNAHRKSTQVAKADASGSLLRRSSFFGAKGGGTVAGASLAAN